MLLQTTCPVWFVRNRIISCRLCAATPVQLPRPAASRVVLLDRPYRAAPAPPSCAAAPPMLETLPKQPHRPVPASPSSCGRTSSRAAPLVGPTGRLQHWGTGQEATQRCEHLCMSHVGQAACSCGAARALGCGSTGECTFCSKQPSIGAALPLTDQSDSLAAAAIHSRAGLSGGTGALQAAGWNKRG